MRLLLLLSLLLLVGCSQEAKELKYFVPPQLEKSFNEDSKPMGFICTHKANYYEDDNYDVPDVKSVLIFDSNYGDLVSLIRIEDGKELPLRYGNAVWDDMLVEFEFKGRYNRDMTIKYDFEYTYVIWRDTLDMEVKDNDVSVLYRMGAPRYTGPCEEIELAEPERVF